MADEDDIVEFKVMDSQLADAAYSGNVRVLRQALASCDIEEDYSYFLCTSTANDKETNTLQWDGNIFHLAAWSRKVDFFREAMERLPSHIVQILLSRQDPCTGRYISNANPLMVASYMGALDIVKLIIGFYQSLDDITYTNTTTMASSSSSSMTTKPWLAQDSKGKTSLHLAIDGAWEDTECAVEVLSIDLESLPNMVDDNGLSSLFIAVEKGYTTVALAILNSGHPYSLSGRIGYTPLHFAPYCSEEVCRQLLESHPKLVKVTNEHKTTVMQTWARIGKLWPFKCLLEKNEMIPDEMRRDFLELILEADKQNENPLHDAARCENHEIAKILVDAYREASKLRQVSNQDQDPVVPWLKRNKYEKTPLELAIRHNNEEVALCFLSPEISSILQSRDNSPLFLAIEKGCYKVAEKILDMADQNGWSTSLNSDRGRNILHDGLHYTEEVVTWLVTKFPSLISMKDVDGKTPLHEAAEAGKTRLIEVMLEKDPSSLKKAPLAWVEACKRGHIYTVLAFINKCPDFKDVCNESGTTPLHYIRLQHSEDYENFLKSASLMWEFKNFQDKEGATALHQAIRNGNMQLTEVLLTKWKDGVSRTIKDRTHATATDLLVEQCSKNLEWDDMCQRIIPGLKTTYFQDMTNLLEVRNTLSVVAALLATITFTAGFTLPGGFNSDTGDAILAEKAGFIVFLLADALAMCCSMLVLVFLIWSMTDRNKSLELIDRSMPILMLALYSTILAFMTGVFIVIPNKSLWAVIIILVMCSLTIMASKRSITYRVLRKLSPVTNKQYRYDTKLLEQGKTSRCCGGSGSWIQGKACTCLGGNSSQQQIAESESEPLSGTIDITIEGGLEENQTCRNLH